MNNHKNSDKFVSAKKKLESFSEIRKLIDNISIETNINITKLETLFGMRFELLASQPLPNYAIYQGFSINKNSLFCSIEARLALNTITHPSIVVCKFSSRVILSIENIMKFYKKSQVSIEFSPAYADAPIFVPYYISITYPNIRVSYGYDRNTRKVLSFIIDTRFK